MARLRCANCNKSIAFLVESDGKWLCADCFEGGKKNVV